MWSFKDRFAYMSCWGLDVDLQGQSCPTRLLGLRCGPSKTELSNWIVGGWIWSFKDRTVQLDCWGLYVVLQGQSFSSGLLSAGCGPSRTELPKWIVGGGCGPSRIELPKWIVGGWMWSFKDRSSQLVYCWLNVVLQGQSCLTGLLWA
ncbi:hypothetical protein XELAEV_18026208mg [Xenopus laevis]|uniref:Uncharacterized protein n=1 Tax=Xenopus laevis TaxID=8355 RepID=A0A974CV71_XENLA|nr:hypothetical protein XELAEV_18026208mg [Xenopus laevis]